MKVIFKVITASYLVLFLIIASVFPFQYVNAEFSKGASMSSTNFKVIDAQHGSFGGVSSSSSGTYILMGSIGDIAIGSSSITNFKLRSGFLYYPQVIAPVLNSATAGMNQVSLAWTAATGLQGFSISGYNVCAKTTGAYTCEDVGNVVVFTKFSLTADTEYTFEIEAKDAIGDIIAVSNELSATPSGDGNVYLGSVTAGQAELPAGVTSVVLTNTTILDLSSGLSGGAVTLQSGVDDQPVVLTNSNLAGVSASIPDGTKIQGFAGWDGKITPPVAGTPSGGNAPTGFSIGSTVISIGSPDGTLVFDNPVTILLTGVTGTMGYRPSGSNTWVQITNVCGGTYDTPNPPTSPGECAISNGIDTKIVAYHFTSFGSLISTPTPTPTPTPPPSGGGGGGGGYYPTPTPSGDTGTVTLSGISYPQSTVTIYKGGVLATTIQAGVNAKFEATLTNVPVGLITISLNSQDPNGRKSLTIFFNVTVIKNTTVALTDILLPPTIDVSATQLNRGDTLRIFGQAQPISEVNVHVFSDEIVNKVIADSDGAYMLSFNTQPLVEDAHITKSRAVLSSVVSPFSQVLQFILGKGFGAKTADPNKDGKVNIIDFSILLFWWNTSNAKGISISDVNKDGKVNIIDFSIMLFQWTG